MTAATAPVRTPPPPNEGPEQEFEMSPADFARVRQLIYERAGIHLNDGKQAMVYSRLARRLRDTGHRSFSAYLQTLQASTGATAEAEWQQFVNCLTTNLTSFFREPHHFEALTEELRQRSTRVPRIWCNAASTGEEPYSLAMTVAEAMGAQTQPCILATDIDTHVLATARAGVYAADSRGLSETRLKRHFLRGKGAHEGRIRIKPELARMVRFEPFNLMNRSWRFDEAPFDIVFCRNVMIYFDAQTQRQVLQRMHEVTAPGALLFVGHSENFTDSRDLFRLRGKTIYQRM